MPGPFTSTIPLAWDANGESDVAGYKLYVGRASGVYDQAGSPVSMGNTTSGSYQITASGAWFFALTCFDSSNNESGKSTEITKNFLLLGNF